MLYSLLFGCVCAAHLSCELRMYSTWNSAWVFYGAFNKYREKITQKMTENRSQPIFSFVICFSLRLINVFESIIMWIIIQNNVQSSNERWRDQVICIKNSCYLHFGISGLGWISFGYTFALAINRQKQEAIHRNVSFWIQYSVIPFNFRLFQGDKPMNFNGLIERIEWQ